jgi:ATP-dependent DNA helicase RecG
MIEKKDLEKLKKIDVYTILDLALIAPIKYENNKLYHHLTGEEQIFEAELFSIHQYPKYTKIKSYLLNVGIGVDLLYFNIKSWQLSQLKSSKTIFIKGKIKNYQIIQPKFIKEVGEIVPIYKTGLNSKVLKELIKKYITIENLEKEVPHKIAKNLYQIHFPKEKVPQLENNYSLKWAEIFNYLLKLKRKRKIYPAIKQLNKDVTPFIQRLPFELTNSQKSTIKEIQKDLNSTKQARRVVIGDVGSGKTIVMLASAYIAEKSIIMCPTSILASQIYEEAKKYLSEFKITLVSQKSKFTQKELEESNLLVGTHALLYQELPQVDLVMVDEQHRFGTMQREQIARMTSEGDKLPHFLQFSATPIPRTQALIYSNFVDLSLITDLPFKKEIETYVIDRDDFKTLLQKIVEEIEKGNQIIIVYPLVEESNYFEYQSLEEGKEFWLKHFEKVYITHGKDKNKEKIVEEFKEYGNILLTTTIIEVGISLPRLTTIVIVGAERMGLATLHQLRGRVARYGQKGFCYLYTNDKKNRRLQSFAKTMDGFKIAELDLQFRKSGDLLSGTTQSGKSFKFFDEVKDEKILFEVQNYLKLLQIVKT